VSLEGGISWGFFGERSSLGFLGIMEGWGGFYPWFCAMVSLPQVDGGGLFLS
jgi:hypothetical protein